MADCVRTLPKRLDEGLDRLEQGDLQILVKAGSSDRQFRKMVLAQRILANSILLGTLILSASLLFSANQILLAIIPVAFSVPIFVSWLRLQAKLKKDDFSDRIQHPGT